MTSIGKRLYVRLPMNDIGLEAQMEVKKDIQRQTGRVFSTQYSLENQWLSVCTGRPSSENQMKRIFQSLRTSHDQVD